jgi:hypothetical protein
VLAAGAWLVLAPPAAAEIEGPCEGQAVLTPTDGGGPTVDVDGATDARVTIPRSADVEYSGSIAIPNPTEDMPHSGEVVLVLPSILPDVTVASWSWSDTTDATETTGSTSYDIDLPAGVLGAVQGTAEGNHTQAGVSCTGSLEIEIDGSAVNAGSIGSAVGTVLAGAGMVLAARGRP